MSSEEQNDAASHGNSLGDRISKPAATPPGGMSASATPFQPKSGHLWSDETASPTSPVAANITNLHPQPQGAEKSVADTAPEVPSKPATMAQDDGATTPFNGSVLQESDYSVQIKLADLQADPNNPLYSVSTFEELNL